jgi:hypothetical protein
MNDIIIRGKLITKSGNKHQNGNKQVTKKETSTFLLPTAKFGNSNKSWYVPSH